jgi:enamine deaminase RidA (YjgF/YER057c/UK114 family)
MSSSPIRTQGQSPMLPGTVTVGDMIFTSGLVAPAAFSAIGTGETVAPEVQIADTLQLLATTLDEAGTTLQRVVRLEAFLSSADLTPIWNRHFQELWPVPGPARITLVARFTSPVIHFEVQAIAAR